MDPLALKIARRFLRAYNDKPYIVRRKGDAVVLYGPFPNEDEARMASYFNLPEMQDRHPSTYPYGLEAYDDAEIAAISESPDEYNYTSFKVLPPSKLSVHPFWKKLLQGIDPHDWWQHWYYGKGDLNGKTKREARKLLDAWKAAEAKPKLAPVSVIQKVYKVIERYDYAEAARGLLMDAIGADAKDERLFYMGQVEAQLTKDGLL
jgi:hypothetical protein